MNRKIMISLLCACFLTACDNNETKPISIEKTTMATTASGASSTLPIFDTFTGLSTPESVTLANNKVYISNLGGNPGNSMGLGFLNQNDIRFISELDDPKGMAVIENGRFGVLSDNPNVKLINLTTGEIVHTLPISGAQFLNDAVTLSDTEVLISDTATGNIHKISIIDNELVYAGVLITADQLNGNGINGLAYDPLGRILYMVTSAFGGDEMQGHIYQAQLTDSLALAGDIESWSSQKLGNGNLDGLVLKGNNLIISDWESDTQPARIFIYAIDTKQEISRLEGNFYSPADITLNPTTNVLLIPQFTKNIVSEVDISSLLSL